MDMVKRRQLSLFHYLEELAEIKAQEQYNDKINSRRCWVCDREFDSSDYLEKGHLIDSVIGGNDSWENLRSMCGECNWVKPLTGSLVEAVAWKVAREIKVQEGHKHGGRLIKNNPLGFMGIVQMIIREEFGADIDIIKSLKNSKTWPNDIEACGVAK